MHSLETGEAGPASATAPARKRGRSTSRRDDRRDGQRQITYNGRPLYYYVGDKSPGQILCQNLNEFGGTWLVVDPNGLLVRWPLCQRPNRSAGEGLAAP